MRKRLRRAFTRPAALTEKAGGKDVTSKFLGQDAEAALVEVDHGKKFAVSNQRHIFMHAGLIVPGIVLKKFAMVQEMLKPDTLAVVGVAQREMYKAERLCLEGVCMGPPDEHFWRSVRGHLTGRDIGALVMTDYSTLRLPDVARTLTWQPRYM